MKKNICFILIAAIIITSTLIFPLSASAADAPVALNTLSAGDTVSFGGETWIVLNPTTGYLILQGHYSEVEGVFNYFAFDSTGSTSYAPTSETNIAYALNNDFYDSLGADAELVQSKTWNIGRADYENLATVTCKIGMISMSEASTYLALNILGSISDGWWTLTPDTFYAETCVNTLQGNGTTDGIIEADYTQEMVRPTLYLSPSVLVSGGDGGTVLGGKYQIPTVTGISPTEGSSQGGTEVTITGTGLNEATSVYFGDTSGTITSTTDAAITVTAPEGTGVVDITVTNAWGTSSTSSDDQFQYILTQATPTFNPAEGAVAFGTELQIISDGAEHIYYTTDGTDPDTSSTEYDDTNRPVIDSAMTVKAIATASGKATSAIASASYTQAGATLTDLEISGSPDNFTFVADQYTYDDITVASNIESVTVTPTGIGTITVNGTTVASGTASDAIALTEVVEKSITIIVTETGKSSTTYTINITRAQFAASITNNGITTKYDTLSAALAAADNDTVTLLRDITETVSYTATSDNTITFDGQNHTITGEDYIVSQIAALTLSGTGNVILKDLTIEGGKATSMSYGLLVSGGSVNVLCEGTVNACGALDNTASSNASSVGLAHMGSGVVNITNATGGLAYGSDGVTNYGAGTVNVTTAATYGSGSKYSGYSYGVVNYSTGTVNVTNASGSTSWSSEGVFNAGTGTVNVTNATGGEASYISFGVCGSNGPINVANPSATAGATYSATTNCGSNVHTGDNITTLTLNRGSGESCVLDAITIAKNVSTNIGILPVVMKDGVEYSWYSDSAKMNLFNATTVEATAEGVTVTNLYSGLPVSDSTIDISAISGVTVPVTGAVPVSTIADTTEYTATISWSPAASTFAESTVYTATITITPKTGYTLTGVTENFFTVAGATATNTADSGMVTAVFPATAAAPVSDQAIDIAAITGVTVPVRGGTPTSSITDTTEYSATISWSPAASTFAESTVYTATIAITPKTGYTLTGVTENFFTVAGAMATNIADSGVVTAVFPATAAAPVSDQTIDIAAITGVTVPVTGAVPTSTIADTTQYTATISWSPTASTFAASTVYTATITIIPKTGYTLTGVSKDFFTVYGATATNAADDGVVTAVFPATAAAPVSDQAIDIAAITGVTVPVRGGTPISSITDTTEYTATISWSPAASTFAASTVYTATITITAKTGYTLTGVTENFFTVAGATATNATDDGVVTAVFPKTASSSTSTGGGGSSSSENSNNSNITISAEGNVTTGTASVTGSTSSGNQTVTVPGNMMTSLTDTAKTAENGGGTAVAIINTGSGTGLNSVGITIPGTQFDSFASGTDASLQFSTGIGDVTFSSDAVDAIDAAGSGDMSFDIGMVDTSTLTSEQQSSVGDRPVYSFSVTVGDTTVSEFGGTVTATLPYTLKEGENLNAIVVYYVDASGDLQMMQGAYDETTGMVTFETTHFSYYVIGYNKVGFTDVADTAWYNNAVTFLSARGITSGTTEITFGPDTTLTRGQFITLLLRAYGVEADANTTNNFADGGNTYYTGYLSAAKRLGISIGVGNNMFTPEKAITRQEMFTMLYNALKVLDKLPEGTCGKTLSDFTDAGDVSSWANEAITALVKAGTVSGNGGRLFPTDTTTRAEMVQVLYNLLGK